ncbi:MAG: hypothetical protein R3D52_13315 [Xanthobacteraceae bacterium]
MLNNQYMGMVRQWQELPYWRPLLLELHRGAARLRQACGGLSRGRHPLHQAQRTRRRHSRDDR